VAVGVQEAVTCFQYAVRSSDDDAAAWIGLGRAYHSLQMEAAALRAMDKAVELRGGKGRGEVGLMQLASGLVEEAALSLQVAREEGGEGDVILAKALAEAALIQVTDNGQAVIGISTSNTKEFEIPVDGKPTGRSCHLCRADSTLVIA
jgi:Flp pilus assembly protein TadD